MSITNEKITIIYTASQAKQRLDKVMQDKEQYNLSRSQLQRLIKNGHVLVNNQAITDIAYMICPNDVIDINLVPQDPVNINPKNITLDIVYEDEHLMVINKPAGLTVHPGAGNYDDTLVNGLIHHYEQNLSSIGGEQRPGIVHRLDRNTSGLMLVAKDNITHAKLTQQLQERLIKRIYWVFVWNAPYKRAGTININIDRHKKHRTKMAISLNTGKTAITHYTLIKTFYNRKLSLIECKLETGRTHQIRVHMQYAKMPVIADPEYCQITPVNVPLADELRQALKAMSRQCLHAKELSFIHPISEKPLDFISSLPEDLEHLKKILEIYEDK